MAKRKQKQNKFSYCRHNWIKLFSYLSLDVVLHLLIHSLSCGWRNHGAHLISCVALNGRPIDERCDWEWIAQVSSFVGLDRMTIDGYVSISIVDSRAPFLANRDKFGFHTIALSAVCVCVNRVWIYVFAKRNHSIIVRCDSMLYFHILIYSVRGALIYTWNLRCSTYGSIRVSVRYCFRLRATECSCSMFTAANRAQH